MNTVRESTEINWATTDEDQALIERIVERAIAEGHLLKRNRLNTQMDITACHLNGTPLRLADFLAADAFNFAHDLFGIDKHMDRSTGKLTGHFQPRFSA